MKKICSLLMLVLAISGASLAEEKTLSAVEIKNLLQGNTAVGRWIDHNYRQFFNADGSTIYAQEKCTLVCWSLASKQYDQSVRKLVGARGLGQWLQHTFEGRRLLLGKQWRH